VITARALLFDMDGLMVDSEPLWFEVERDFARAHGGDWTLELAASGIGKGLDHTLQTMHRTFGLPLDRAAHEAEIVDRFLAGANTIAIKPGCREFLAAGRGVVPMAAASSSVRRLVHGVLEGLGLAPSFDAIVSGDDVVKPKPAPDIFLEAARRLGVEPGDCVVLEDSLAGTTAAHAAGMAVIAVPERPTPGIERVATKIVADLHEALRSVTLVPNRGR
jgi:beta-phosphoglucomutase-like phosphatase (HAD superfamily)